MACHLIGLRDCFSDLETSILDDPGASLIVIIIVIHTSFMSRVCFHCVSSPLRVRPVSISVILNPTTSWYGFEAMLDKRAPSSFVTELELKLIS